MKLTHVSISNYRSITTAHKIDLANLTVLLGKNNEGKTNVLKAINLGMNVLRNMEMLQRRRIFPKQFYDWNEDYPLSMQLIKKKREKATEIRMDFLLNDTETEDLFREIHSNINGVLSLYIKICEGNYYSITIPKKGKNAKSLSTKLMQISKLICEKFDVAYIPAIRSEDDALGAISELVNSELSSIDDQVYKDALEYIEKIHQERLASLAGRVKIPLVKFLPQIKSLNIYMTDKFGRNNSWARKILNIDIDDGVLTSLSNKGDGVKSLATIAMLSQVSTNKDRLIVVDEPENHLHPDAVRYICGVLNGLANDNQVLVSTHNPIFVNRSCISSNWIVENGETHKANRIDDIRQTLGVICSDNLMYSDYVVVVEGPTDRALLDKFFGEDTQLRACMDSGFLTIRSIGGINNLKSEIYSLQRYCCNYIVILDYDRAGKNAANDIRQTLSVPSDKIRHFMRSTRGESELEDLYEPSVYSTYFLDRGIDISDPLFRNAVVKWTTRLENILANAGVDLKTEDADVYKENIAKLIKPPLKDRLTRHGYDLLTAIRTRIKEDVLKMTSA